MMKIIHTADWHLGDRLGPRIDRTADLRVRVERVAQLCEQHSADVLLIAGDIFSEDASVDHMTESLGHISKTFEPFFRRGGTIVAITGNHDRDGRINFTRSGMKLAAPIGAKDGVLQSGRLHIINGLTYGNLVSASGQQVQFVFVPYPFRSRYELESSGVQSLEQEHNQLREKVANWVSDVSNRPSFNAKLPTVLTAHLHVRGTEAHSLYKLTERDDILFNMADLSPSWAYVALGHIHKPQAVNGQANVRYPGSLDRLDFGETHDEHGVLLVEIGPSGLVREPIHLPIPATPFHRVHLTNPETELKELSTKYPDRETSIFKVTVDATQANISRDELTRDLRRLFPRLHELKWIDESTPTEVPAVATIDPRASLETTVRSYLEERFKDHPDKADLLALAETFLREGGAA